MIDKAKVMKEAQKLLAKGQVDKAIVEWQKISDAYPDGNTFNYIGDLYIKKGDRDAAITEFHKAAKIYMDEGFSLKALAIHKKVLNINPRDPGALIALGELNEEKNIATDAIKYYLAAADVLLKENRKDELLKVYDRILNLAPKNIKLRVKVAEMFSKEGFVPEAAREYSSIGELYLERDDLAGAREYFTKSFEILPSNADVLMKLSTLAEREGKHEQAAEYLQTAVERTGETPEINLRRASLLSMTGKVDEAIKVIDRVIEADSGNVMARKQLADLHQKAGDIAAAWGEYQLVIDALINNDQLDEAVQILTTFRDFEPVGNRRKLVSLYKMQADEEGAYKELLGLSEVLLEKEKINEAGAALKEALDIKPGGAEARERLSSIEILMTEPDEAPEPEPVAAPPKPAAVVEPVAEPEPGPVAEPAPTAGEKTLDEALNEADVFFKYGLYNDAKELLEGLKVKNPGSTELHEKLKKLYIETNETELIVTECIVLNALYKSAGDTARAEAAMAEALKVNPSDARLAGKGPGGAAPAAEAPKKKATLKDYADELSEADFYIQQGFFSEAAEIYRKLLEAFPNHPDLSNKLRDMENRLASATPAAPIPAAAPAAAPVAPPVAAAPPPSPFMGEEAESDGLFDIGSIFENEAEAASVASELDDDVLGIFNEFKKGLAQEIEAEDAATHYDLGIAYKEMGIVDDAIKEFHVASRDPNYFVQAMSMIGLMYMHKGDFRNAAEGFGAALMKVPPGDDMVWSLKYELAVAYERYGSLAEALQLYRDVSSWNSNFRDVASKLAALGSAGADDGPPPPPTPEPMKAKDKKSRVSYI
jgi:tetratricopeptide (TPR) repeat protein